MDGSCQMCNQRADALGSVCAHLPEARLLTYAKAATGAIPDVACTRCETLHGGPPREPDDAGAARVCATCHALVLRRNIEVTRAGSARGFELALRQDYCAATEQSRPHVPAVSSGSFAKLAFSIVPSMHPTYLESMWVRVRKRDGDTIRGELANDPGVFPADVLSQGAIVGFGSANVIDARSDIELLELEPGHDCDLCNVETRAERTELDDADRKLLTDVGLFGWHNVLVSAAADNAGDDGDDDTPAFGFTVGLHHTFDHPELVVFGLGPEIHHDLLNRLACRVRAGEVIEIERDYDGIIEGYPCQFRALKNEAHYFDYLGFAAWFYGSPFPVLQLCWPDLAGRFAWQQGFDDTLRVLQPRLDL